MWLYDVFKMPRCKLKYCDTKEQAADIFTKLYREVPKWLAVVELIGMTKSKYPIAHQPGKGTADIVNTPCPKVRGKKKQKRLKPKFVLTGEAADTGAKDGWGSGGAKSDVKTGGLSLIHI